MGTVVGIYATAHDIMGPIDTTNERDRSLPGSQVRMTPQASNTDAGLLRITGAR